MGFNLSGLSAITRANSTIYHDDEIDGVDFDTNDKFALDGNRLISISASEYKTELETFSRIISYGTSGNGPSYFKVCTKDGKTIEYGNTANSKIEAKGKSDILTWLINKITDQYGNYMQFEYNEDITTHEFQISEIKYTGTSSFIPYNKVTFHYETRIQDAENGYVGGSEVVQTKLLYAIKTWCEGNLVKTYFFRYTEDFYTHLNEVIEYNKDGEQYNSTVFEWGSQGTDVVESNINWGTSEQYLIYPGDFSGDGKTDFVRIPDKEFYDDNDKAIIFLSDDTQPDGFLQTNHEISIGDIHFDTWFKDIDIKMNMPIQNVDFNGDGKMEYFMKRGVINFNREICPDLNANAIIYTYSIHYINSNNQLEKQFLGTNCDPDKINSKITIGDFNGDKKTELFLFYPDINQWELIYYHEPNSSSHSISGWSGIDEFKTGDFNGDGKTDIYVIDYQGTNANLKIYDYNSSPSESLALLNETNLTDYTSNCDIEIADFNGDGKSDILYLKPTSKIYFSTGTGFNIINAPITWVDNPDVDDKRLILLIDFNGDGKTDICKVQEEFNTSDQYERTRWRYFLSMGETFEEFKSAVLTQDRIDEKLFSAGDFNGDGYSDLFYYSTASSLYEIEKYNVNKNLYKLTGIKDGLNKEINITYNPLSNTESYTPVSEKINENVMRVTFPLYVVTDYSFSNGISLGSKSFIYKKALLNTNGKGFLGFEYMRERDEQTSIDIISENQYDFDTYFNLTQSKITTQRLSTQISKQTIDYDEYEIISGKPIIFQYADFSSDEDFLNQNKTNTINEFDNNGNLTLQKQLFYEGSAQIAEKQLSYNNYADRITSDLNTTPNGPEVQYEKSSHTDDGISNFFSKKTKYVYNSKGAVYQKVEFEDLTNKITTTNEFYTNGLIKKITFSDAGNNSRFTSFEYDLKYRLMTKEINSLSHSLQYTYDFNTGNMLTVKDPNNLTTTNRYNAFGRLTETESPEGLISRYETNWYEGTSIPNCIFYSVFSTDVGDHKTEYFDVLGRVLKTTLHGYSTESIQTDYTYNNKGQLVTETLPYLSGSTPVTSTFNYDYYGRIISKISPVCTLSYSYPLRQVKLQKLVSSNLLEETIKTFNALGMIKTTQDDGGTIAYSYHKTLQPKQISLGGINTDITYDPYGRQNTLDDPDAGTTTYLYNGFGELHHQIDENNYFILNYDQLGRVYQKIESQTGEIINYTYDTRKYGLLSGVTYAAASTSVAYYYDSYSRISSKTETVDSKDFTTSYSYDDYGRLNEYTYPSGFTVTNHYNSNGYLYQVKRGDDGAVIWEGEQMNAFGQFKQYKTGSDLRTVKTYDNLGTLQRIKTNKISGGQTVQNLEYNFNTATGNLIYRQDDLWSQSEEFLYDHQNGKKLNRLTRSTVGSTVTNISYADNGNILQKGDAGTYVYNTSIAGPHAPVEITSPTSNISHLQQDISYNIFSKVKKVAEQTGINWIDFTYGPDAQRMMTKKYLNGQLDETKYFLTNYEEVNGTARQIHYIYGGDGLAAIYEIKNGSPTLYYAFTDHLGSLHYLTNPNYSVSEYYSFDPWGRRRNPTNWQDYSNTPHTLTDRGFTMHEHLDDFSLINMNGRVYDPVLGQFLSPDNYVATPGFSQGYNRYAYCLNNPLIYTDPSGDHPLGWLVPTLINTIQNYNNAISNGLSKEQAFGYSLSNFATSAVSSVLNIPGIIPNAGLHAGINILGNGLTNLSYGNDFFANWGSNALSGALSGGLSGYQLSKQGGLNYWWGTEQSNWGYNRNQWSLAWWDKPDKYKFQADYPNIVNLNNFQCDGTTFSSTHGNTNEYWQSKLDARGQYEPYTRVYIREGLDFQIGGNMEDIRNYYYQGYDKLHLRVADYGPNGDYHRMAVRKIIYVPSKKLIFKVYDPGAGVSVNGGSPNFSKTYNVFKGVNFKFNEFVLFK